jgi:hexosaminidase
MRKFKFTIYCFLIFLLCWGQQKTYIIPEPKELEVNSGSFILSGFTSFIYPGSAETTASLFNEILFSNYGIQLKKGKTKINAVRLIEDNAMKSEEYQLIVNEDGVLIRGKEDGLFYGTQTLLQLISQNEEGVLTIPFVEINDEPRFTYPGVLVDVGRYFFSEDCIKRFIDRMAYYKLNTFHWHLTEDGGWRIEIKKYPELTQKGAWRSSSQKTHNPKDQDRIPHGGFYTQ